MDHALFLSSLVEAVIPKNIFKNRQLMHFQYFVFFLSPLGINRTGLSYEQTIILFTERHFI